MRMPMMCFSILRAPRCNVYSLVNTWWEGFGNASKKEGYNFRLIGSSACVHGGNSRRWSRKTITTTSEGSSANTLSSVTNITHGIISEKIVETRSTELTINSDYSDVRELIVDNKDLAGLGTFIVFDLETTGFSTSDRIVEIALQDLLGGENSTFYALVNPEKPVLNAHIHGVTNNMVLRPDVPRMEQLIPILLEFVKSRQKPGGYVVLVAHNARRFDVPFLVKEFKRCSIEIPSNWLYLDTIPLGREAMASQGMKPGASVSLQALREHYGIELQGKAHSAMSDVRCLSLVLQKMTFDLKLPIAGLVQRTFRASELTVSSAKKKKASASAKKQ